MSAIIKLSRVAQAGVLPQAYSLTTRAWPRKPVAQPDPDPADSSHVPAEDKLPSTDDEAPSVLAVDVQPSEELEYRVYAEAYRQGHADGSREGWESGNEDGLREGWKQGYEEGRHAALEEAETSARQYAEAGARIAQAIQSASEHCARALEAGAIEIAHAAILRIAGSSAGNREFVVGIVRQLIEELPERKLLSIRLAPDDFALLQQQSAELACHAGLLQADERVGLGGCIIDTDAGSLDGRLETQLAELRETLLSAHRTREETA